MYIFLKSLNLTPKYGKIPNTDMERDYHKDSFEKELKEILNEVYTTVSEKNEGYGNFALNPIPVLSQVSASMRIRVRLDEKLGRLAHLLKADPIDVMSIHAELKDIIGYEVLLIMHTKETENKKE